MIGLNFQRHKHGSGAEHYAQEGSGAVFELYPLVEGKTTTAARIGFEVDSVDAVVRREAGAEITAEPKDSPWGRRAVVVDPDGHRIEITELPRA